MVFAFFFWKACVRRDCGIGWYLGTLLAPSSPCFGMWLFNDLHLPYFDCMWQRLIKFVSKVHRKGWHDPRTLLSCPRHKILFLTFCSGDLASRYHQQHGGCGQRRRAKQVKSNLFNSRWCQIQRQKGKTSFQATICRSTWTRRVSRSVGLELLLGWGRQVKHFSCKSTIKTSTWKTVICSGVSRTTFQTTWSPLSTRTEE